MIDDGLKAACLMDGIELLEPIGQGGSGVVWGARWRSREVAVKVLEGRHFGQPRRPLTHPAILDVLGEGEALGRSYVILERFPTDLSQLLDKRPLRPDLRRAILLQLLDAVDFAHSRDVVHGDLKPANVLVDPSRSPPRVALTDFGLGGLDASELDASMLSRERETNGVSTLAYLAPERRSGDPPTAASDVFALGVIVFEVLTGRLPVGFELPSELEPGVDRRFDKVVKLAMARDPRDRPGIASIRRDLLRIFPRGGSNGSADGPSLISIPAGHVVIGNRDDPEAAPPYEAHVPAFQIDPHPVTHRDYLAFVLATGAARPRAWPKRGKLPRRLLELPVTGVSWIEASAYAAWAKKRLPTEEEWERAAQGPEQRSFPWGDAYAPERVHADPRRLRPVGDCPEAATSEGVFDLLGNGWEWTSSPWRRYGGEPKARSGRVIRGGVRQQRSPPVDAHVRTGLRPDVRDPGVTFRCARDGAC